MVYRMKWVLGEKVVFGGGRKLWENIYDEPVHFEEVTPGAPPLPRKCVRGPKVTSLFEPKNLPRFYGDHSIQMV